MQYHIARSGQLLGVFEEVEIRSGLAAGRFLQDDLYWAEGMADWMSLSSRFLASPPALGSAPGPFNPDAAPQTSLPVPSSQLKLASLGARLGAHCLDTLTLFLGLLPSLVAFAMIAAQASTATGEPAAPEDIPAEAIGAIALTVLIWLALAGYNIYLLATVGQTLGKKWMQIRIVTHPQGENPGFAKSFLLRSFVNCLIGQFVPLYAIIDICFIFREDRRCLHDLIAETTVVGGNPPPAS